MQIQDLKLNNKKKGIRRIGRGGKRGTYSGRGQKGQKARAGRKIRPSEIDTILRMPKLKGVKNRSLKEKALVLNTGVLDKKFEDKLINKEILFKNHLIKKLTQPVKILGEGEIKKAYIIEGLMVSETARKKIIKAGGEIK